MSQYDEPHEPGAEGDDEDTNEASHTPAHEYEQEATEQKGGGETDAIGAPPTGAGSSDRYEAGGEKSEHDHGDGRRTEHEQAKAQREGHDSADLETPRARVRARHRLVS
jgi:hypothetical protein